MFQLQRAIARASMSLLAVLAVPAIALAQGRNGTVTGRVTDAENNQPVPNAQVVIVGTPVGTLTGADGRYTIRNAPVGNATIRTLRIGYGESSKPAVITAGGTTTLDFTLSRVAVTLSPVVATATGEQERLSVPNQISQIDAAKVLENAQVTNVSDMLTAKAAGVQLLPGSGVGAASRIRIRGIASLSLGNDPIVILDGVRVNSSTSGLGTGGAPESRLNDINPEDIETIDILRGPAASATYGTDAATGVIVITTKRGRPGAARWNVYTEQGVTQDKNEYPDAYTAWGKLANQTNPANNGRAADCSIPTIANGTCVVDSITTFNLWEDPRATPLKNGVRQQYGFNVSGGNEAVNYFMGMESERTTGVLTVPQFDLDRYARQGVIADPAWTEPNMQRRASLRANLDVKIGNNFQLPIRTYFQDSRLRQPNDGNNTVGLGSHAFGGPGTKLRTLGGDSLYGYRQFTPGDIFQQVTTQDVQRYIGSVSPVWTPLTWLQTRSNLGLDFANESFNNYCLRDLCPNFGQFRLGFIGQSRASLFQYTADASATASFRPLEWLSTRTTGGFQFIHRQDAGNSASGSQLPTGGRTLSQASVPGVSEFTTVSKTAGMFVEQNLQFNDRLDLVASIRGDQNSAFGKNFGVAYYPRLGASYRISEEEWFPYRSMINLLRLRTSWGQAGLRPGTTAALQFFAGNVYRTNSLELPGLIYQTLGNANLEPETVTESEGGFDLGMFEDRFTATVTYYYKRSAGAIINAVLAPSLGTGATTRAQNLGAVRNLGWEYILTGRPVALENFSWDITFNGSNNENRLLSLGDVPPTIGANQRNTPGYPISGFWQRPYTYTDANNNGMIEISEVTVAADPVFVGPPQPRNEISIQNGFDLFQSQLRLSALVDIKTGYRILNTTERFRCGTRVNAQERVDPSAPLDRQARCAAFLQSGSTSTQYGYMEDASFTRLREVAVTWRVPESLVTRAPGLRNSTITVAGRNLALWTDYTGVDPETAGGGLGETQDEFQITPPLRTWTVRFNLGF